MGSGVAWLLGLHRFESCVGTWVTRVQELPGCVGYMGSGVVWARGSKFYVGC